MIRELRTIKQLQFQCLTSVPPEVKMMSSALPPTMLATSALALQIRALALAPAGHTWWETCWYRSHLEAFIQEYLKEKYKTFSK